MDISKNVGSSLGFAGAAFGGAIAGNILASKIKFFDTLIGRIVLMGIGIVILAYSKSDMLKGVGTGVAISGGQGLIKKVAKSVNGIDGMDGLFGLGDAGIGELVQDANGMLYMTNGVGSYEQLETSYLNGDEYALSGDEDAMSGITAMS